MSNARRGRVIGTGFWNIRNTPDRKYGKTEKFLIYFWEEIMRKSGSGEEKNSWNAQRTKDPTCGKGSVRNLGRIENS